MAKFKFPLVLIFRIPTLIGLALIPLLLLSACGRKGDAPLELKVTRETVLPAPDLPRELWTLDEEFADINRKVPGFAGYTVSSQGVTEVALVDTSALGAATWVLRATLGEVNFSAQQAVVAKKVSYEFNQLAVWREQALMALNLDDVALVDVDEAENQVLVGFIDQAGLEAAQAQRSKELLQSIPADALRFEVTGLAQTDIGKLSDPHLTAAAVGDSIHDPVAPRVGGLALRVPYEDGALCTLGFNAHLVRNGVNERGFVTNSHCSDNLFGPDVLDNVWRQPYDGTLIGREIYDPEPYKYGDCIYTSYDPKYYCRRSDATFVRYLNGVSSQRKIAEANAAYTILKVLGVQRVEKTFVGKPAFKSGAKSGRTIGSVVATCVGQKTVHPNTWFICQDEADYRSEGGDSGSPVYNELPSILLGINRGRLPNGLATFTPFNNIARDLGVSLAVIE